MRQIMHWVPINGMRSEAFPLAGTGFMGLGAAAPYSYSASDKVVGYDRAIGQRGVVLHVQKIVRVRGAYVRRTFEVPVESAPPELLNRSDVKRILHLISVRVDDAMIAREQKQVLAQVRDDLQKLEQDPLYIQLKKHYVQQLALALDPEEAMKLKQMLEHAERAVNEAVERIQQLQLPASHPLMQLIAQAKTAADRVEMAFRAQGMHGLGWAVTWPIAATVIGVALIGAVLIYMNTGHVIMATTEAALERAAKLPPGEREKFLSAVMNSATLKNLADKGSSGFGGMLPSWVWGVAAIVGIAILAPAVKSLMPAKNPARRWRSASEVQTLLLPRDLYNVAQAKAWARDHGYRTDKMDVTGHYIRLRQAAPSQFRDFRTIPFGMSGIKAVIGPRG